MFYLSSQVNEKTGVKIPLGDVNFVESKGANRESPAQQQKSLEIRGKVHNNIHCIYIYIYTYVICVYVYFRFLFLETYCVCNKNICTLHLYCKRMYIYVYTHTLYWHIVQGTMFGFCMFLGWIDTLVLEIVYKQPSRCRSSLGASTLSVLKMTFISTVDGLLVERNVLVTGSSF